MDAPTNITILAAGSAAIIAALLLVGVIISGDIRKRITRCFAALLIFCLLGSLCEVATALLFGTPGEGIAVLIRLIDFVNYLCSCIMLVAFALYVYELLSTKGAVSRWPVILVSAINCAYTLLLATAQVSQIFATLDANNNYVLQKVFWVTFLPPVISFILLSMLIVSHRKRLRLREISSFFIYMTLPLLAYAVELLNPGVWVAYLSTAVALFLIYVNIQMELKRELLKKDVELAESRITIMLSQIKPHYLYNSLVSIERLCDENPAEARVAIMDFADYLRGNMNSLTQQKPIRFSEELTHVRNYLSLELHRFRDRLHVKYDIGAEDFSLPALTLQPLVENAVRHGAQKRREPTTVTITSREEPTCFVVSVIDNAEGFDLAALPDDKQAHIGIPNVRARLESHGAHLELQSIRGKGTTASIFIPKEGHA